MPPRSGGAKGGVNTVQAAQLAALEEEVLRRVQAAVGARVEEAMASEEVQTRIQVPGKGGGWGGGRGEGGGEGGGMDGMGRPPGRWG